jgi:alanine racemase
MGVSPLKARTESLSRSIGSSIDPWLSRPLWAEVDLDAIGANVSALRSRASGAELMAMVKANAYGHGAIAVAMAAVDAGASRLGVAALDEALQLRGAGIQSPILVVGHVSPACAPLAVQLDITLTVNSLQLGVAIGAAAEAAGKVSLVHLKVDTGLNRYGLASDEVIDLARALRDVPGLIVEGLYTHFATADEADKSFMETQVERFLATAESLDWIPLRHCSNSGALIDMPTHSFNLVRPGISIYGLYPSVEVSRSIKLTPAMSLRAKIVRAHRMTMGEATSYGRRWIAAGGEEVALVPCGYGDGYPRRLSNVFHVLTHAGLAPIRGTIAMDQMIVDITGLGAKEGDVVTVFGGAPGSGVSADELAQSASTISYEITTAVSARVPRVFLRSGSVVAVQGLNDPLPVPLGS